MDVISPTLFTSGDVWPKSSPAETDFMTFESRVQEETFYDERGKESR